MLNAFKSTLISACIAATASSYAEVLHPVKHLHVNDMPLEYVEQGRGAPLLLLHGAVSDLRTWNRQRAELAAHYRTIAVTQRYYGTSPWRADWPKYSIETHTDDLAAFIRALGAGPVHLVAWSSGGHIALNVALRHPDLVRTLFIYEPVVPSYVDDPAELKALSDDANEMVGPVLPPMKDGEMTRAARLFIDGVAEHQGYFDALPSTTQDIVLANARALPLMFNGGEQDAPITCAQLAQVKPPLAIARGELVRPFFRIIADAAARCSPGSSRIIVPDAKHMWPAENPVGFAEAVRDFLSGK